MTYEELIRFGKDVRRLAENPFQRQLEEARAEWKRRKLQSGSTFNRRSSNQACRTGVPIRCQVYKLAAKNSRRLRKFTIDSRCLQNNGICIWRSATTAARQSSSAASVTPTDDSATRNAKDAERCSRSHVYCPTLMSRTRYGRSIRDSVRSAAAQDLWMFMSAIQCGPHLFSRHGAVRPNCPAEAAESRARRQVQHLAWC